jgi:hypothetical protein
VTPEARWVSRVMPRIVVLRKGARLAGNNNRKVASAQASDAVMLRPLVNSKSARHRRQTAALRDRSGGKSSKSPQSGHAIVMRRVGGSTDLTTALRQWLRSMWIKRPFEAISVSDYDKSAVPGGTRASGVG